MKRILVVDDEAMNLSVAKYILEKNGYEVLTASSGMECLSVLNEKLVDLILLDVEMPEMNGLKTLKEIRERERIKKIPVMFVTADAKADTVIAAKLLEVSGYVKKPYLPEDLLERVAKILKA